MLTISLGYVPVFFRCNRPFLHVSNNSEIDFIEALLVLKEN